MDQRFQSVEEVIRTTTDIVSASEADGVEPAPLKGAVQRRKLTEKADVCHIAAELSKSINADNDIEQLLAEQLAAAHRLAMSFAARSVLHAQNSEFAHLSGIARVTNAQEATRFAGASARMVLAFNDGLRTLQRMRSGGRQTVVVQHVTVADGAQAIVTGSVNAQDREGGVGNS
jgi:hypothetical protein